MENTIAKLTNELHTANAIQITDSPILPIQEVYQSDFMDISAKWWSDEGQEFMLEFDLEDITSCKEAESGVYEIVIDNQEDREETLTFFRIGKDEYADEDVCMLEHENKQMGEFIESLGFAAADIINGDGSVELDKKKELAFKALEEWKTEARKQYLANLIDVLRKSEKLDILKEIEEFGAILAYPQKDDSVYEGFYDSCISVVFRNAEGLEKAIVTYCGDTFDTEDICINDDGDKFLIEGVFEDFPDIYFDRDIREVIHG